MSFLSGLVMSKLSSKLNKRKERNRDRFDVGGRIKKRFGERREAAQFGSKFEGGAAGIVRRTRAKRRES